MRHGDRWGADLPYGDRQGKPSGNHQSERVSVSRLCFQSSSASSQPSHMGNVISDNRLPGLWQQFSQ